MCYHGIDNFYYFRDARPAPQKSGLAPPREFDKIRESQRGKTDFITPTNYALEEERVGKYFHLTLCIDCDYLVHKNAFLK